MQFQHYHMMKRIRKTLEDKARELATERSIAWDPSIPATLRREIALTREHLERLNLLREDQLRHLLHLECQTVSESLQMRQRTPWYLTIDDHPRQDQLKRQLFEIDKERRKLTERWQDKKQTLEDRLLALINEHEQLNFSGFEAE